MVGAFDRSCQKLPSGTFFCVSGQTETSAMATLGPYNDRPGAAGKPLELADVLMGDLPPDMVEIRERQQRVRRNRFWSMLRSPMAMRFPLFDPDRFLNATMPLLRPLFGVVGLTLFV